MKKEYKIWDIIESYWKELMITWKRIIKADDFYIWEDKYEYLLEWEWTEL